ncbi:MAG: ThuA domain-containing protein [Oscillospiraceae bacterium]
MIRVTVWNEYVHEREYDGIAKVYPKGIHGCIEGFLEKNEDMEVRCATLDMNNQGISEEMLRNTDVLIWWAHARHDDITDENVQLIKNAVLGGMGLVALHSAHYSKIMKALMGTTMSLNWRNNDSETLKCVAPNHPIADGVPDTIIIPHEEMYGEWFDIPNPDDVVFEGTFSRNEKFRSGVTFTRGYGKIFYFQPGHEEYPVYYMPEIQKIITNAVRWTYSKEAPRKLPECHEVK